ncbi:Amino acid permease [Quillaja saponaria]|uniref:Amino acid permease n=1 Tax=Quillaja saponaria TaxID=32244 RepID=A0AAD7PSV6_QUISA|nr:Amino acid permease [Quillaja saponaria]
MEFQKNSMYIETPENGGDVQKNIDDDGRSKRTGTWITASAHIITAVIGSGVLSLAWAIAQLGWVVGPAVLFAFSFITYFTSTLLADCYRSPDPVTGHRNYTYMDVVRSILGGKKVQLCGLAQYINLVGVTIGYTITASISMVAVKRSDCFHKYGHDAKCYISNYPYMIIFACIQLVLSQIPNFHKLSWLSIVAAIMSFTYASIGLGLSIAKVAVGVDVSGSEKVWRTFQAIGDIAFAYAFSNVLIEIQDTLKSTPSENKHLEMTHQGIFSPGFGFYDPFWLIDFANVCIAIHLVGAYQVFCQPIFGFVERWCSEHWPESQFIKREYAINVPFYGVYYLNLFRLVWRSAYVIVTAVVAMIFPFFNDFLGLIGSLSFWPLTVFFPIEMYIKQTQMKKYSFTWTWLKILSWACLIVSIVAAAGSIQGLTQDLKKFKPFQTQQ